jgi:hypothetical protein
MKRTFDRFRQIGLTFASALALSGGGVLAKPPPLLPPPPPPPPSQAPPTKALSHLSGEWQLATLNGRKMVGRKAYTLTIWGPSFTAGYGCVLAMGQLRDLGRDHRFGVEPTGFSVDGCDGKIRAPAPFDKSELEFLRTDDGNLRVSAGGSSALFVWVDTQETVATDDFLRGDWLLADAKGVPYRGADQTRVRFGERGYVVTGPRCNYTTNGWMADRDWIIRPAGNRSMASLNCRSGKLGDRLARAGDRARLGAEPDRLRLTLRQPDGGGATLVPAARFPEFVGTPDPEVINDWATRLAAAAKAMPLARRADFTSAALGGPTPDPKPETPLEALTLQAETIAIARLEAVVPRDRGDGLTYDHRYRQRDNWRGGGKRGDVIIIRSAERTAPSAADVLLFVGRRAYVADRLIAGLPPSIDLQAGLLVAAPVDATADQIALSGTMVQREAARAQVQDFARRIEAARVKPLQMSEVRRYFIDSIDGKPLADPTLYWIDYSHQGYSEATIIEQGIRAYRLGCNAVQKWPANGWISTHVACTTIADIPGARQLIETVEAEQIPMLIDVGGYGPLPFASVEITAGGHKYSLREPIR